jgi:hypothetical protein
VQYPEADITTNRRDDRVHPGHARKFAAKLESLHVPLLYFEEAFGGHGRDPDPQLNARRWARYLCLSSAKADGLTRNDHRDASISAIECADTPTRKIHMTAQTPRLFIPIFATCFSLAVSALAPAVADAANTSQRTVTKLADGVYAIRHKDAPDAFPHGNTTVIIGEREVLVVDSCYLPSSAAEDIAQIREWTTKRVRFLLNTHWHYDHTMGNAAYRDAFPGLIVIAQTETRNQIAGYNPYWFQRFPGRAERAQNQKAATDDVSVE